MKITKEVLQKIIAEEKSAMLEEGMALKMKEGRGSWKAQQRKAFHAANDEYLKTHDKEWWDAHEKRAKEDEYGHDPHSKYEREKASDDMAKPSKKTDESLAEGKLTRAYLQEIIQEEYASLRKEGGGISRGGEPTGDAWDTLGDDEFKRRQTRDAAESAGKTTHEQWMKLADLYYANRQDEILRAAFSAMSLGGQMSRKNYPKLFADPRIAAIFEKGGAIKESEGLKENVVTPLSQAQDLFKRGAKVTVIVQNGPSRGNKSEHKNVKIVSIEQDGIVFDKQGHTWKQPLDRIIGVYEYSAPIKTYRSRGSEEATIAGPMNKKSWHYDGGGDD
jgi:hypothetical protein